MRYPLATVTAVALDRPAERRISETVPVLGLWPRFRSPVILAALLFGSVAPAVRGPRSTLLASLALGAVVAAGWLAARKGGAEEPRRLVATMVYGTFGTALAVVQPNGAALAFPAFACVAMGAFRPPRLALAFAGFLSVGYIVGRWPAQHGNQLWWLVLAAALFFLTTLGGRARAVNTRLAEEAERDRARAAALDERARIAREIHDILAHALAALTVQLETADALLDGGRVAQAQDSVRRAGQLAREGLTETRRAIGALRGDTVPLPELIDALVASYKSNVDTSVTVTVTGEPRILEPDVVLALYRSAQEALTNAQKHAPGAPVDLALRYQPGTVELSVVNGAMPAGAERPLAASGGGYGLAGLRERAELAGGALEAGPVGDGYRVGVTIPA